MVNLTEINNHTDFTAGTTFLINKPITWTSFDVVKKIRNTIILSKNIKKIKVGHAGTLDPLAEGLLIICTGKSTKLINKIQALKKVYEGEFILGSTTPSYDLETKIDKYFNIKNITEHSIYKTAKKFEGNILQKPPIFSAIKKNGKRLYVYARRGEDIEIDPKKVKIDFFNITKINLPIIEFKIKCSKGTYIRSLVHDFGSSLKNGAHLSKLIRISIGKYELKDAISLEKFQAKIAT